MFTLWTCLLRFSLHTMTQKRKKKHIQNYSYLSFLSSLVWWHAPQFFLRLLQPCLVSIVFWAANFQNNSYFIFFVTKTTRSKPKKTRQFTATSNWLNCFVWFAPSQTGLRVVCQQHLCSRFLVNLRHKLYFSRSDENIFYCIFFTSLVRFSSSN